MFGSVSSLLTRRNGLRFWPLQLRSGAFIQIETFYEIFHDVFTKLECSYVYGHCWLEQLTVMNQTILHLRRSACSSNVKRTSSINSAYIRPSISYLHLHIERACFSAQRSTLFFFFSFCLSYLSSFFLSNIETENADRKREVTTVQQTRAFYRHRGPERG